MESTQRIIYLIITSSNKTNTELDVVQSEEITSLPKSKTVVKMARHFNNRRNKTTSSSQELFVYNESLQHPTDSSFFRLLKYSLVSK